MYERFVTRKEAMAAGQQITFEPTLALVLTQHLHHPAIGADVIVGGNNLCSRAAVCRLEYGIPTVRGSFIRTEDAEVSRLGICLEHVANELPLEARGFGYNDAGLRDLDRVVAEVWHFQFFKKKAPIGMW